jgi:predicted outer membrane repeat protein
MQHSSRFSTSRYESKQARRKRTTALSRLAAVVAETLESRMMLSAVIPAIPTVNSVSVNTTQDTVAVNAAVSPLDPGGNVSLRSAVQWANVQSNATTITFDSTVFATAKTINLSGGELDLTGTGGLITITGPPAPLTIDAGGNSRVFHIESGVTAEIDDVTITGGKLDYAGGIRDDGTLTLTNDIISHNQTTSIGGALGVGGKLTSNNTTFDSNTSKTAGVMYEDGIGSTSTFTGCTFSNNSATTGDGGALFIGSASAPTATVNNSTFSGNTAAGEGGAIYFTQGILSLKDSTLSNNTTLESQGSGGGVGVGGVGPGDNQIFLTGNIIAGNFFKNSSGANSPDDISTEATLANGFLVSGINNLIGTGGSGGLVHTDLNGNLVGIANPGLMPFGNYGGPTKTFALLAGSPAIGNGVATNLVTDQRGVSRNGGVLIDIGAYQYSTPATETIAAGDVNGLITYLSPDTTTTIDLTKSNYDFTQVNNNWYGPNALPAILNDVTIDGNGATLQRDSSLPQTTAGAFRFFYVSGGIPNELPLGTLTLQNLTMTNGLAKGGNSISGAGLGAGGAIFNQGSLTLEGVTLNGNAAIGGNSTQSAPGVGGGGMGQDSQSNDSGGGFGGGFQGAAYTTGFHPSNTSGGGGAGLSANATGTTGGGQSGLGAGGGDGGIGGNADVSFDPDASIGVGGDLGTGGENALGNGGGGGVGAGGGFGIEGNGGGGGFGGGGSDDADGGFGGGGGYFHGNHIGVGGFGAGNSNNKGNVGGGGAGLGGAIFSMYGSVTVINSTLTGNSAIGGSSIAAGNGAFGGSGYGGAIFNLDGSIALTLVTDANNTVTAGSGDTGNGLADGGALYNLAYGNNYATGKAVTATATLSNSILAGTIGGTFDLVNQEVDGSGSQNTGNSANVTGSDPNIIVAISGISDTGTENVLDPGVIQSDPKLDALADNGGLTWTMALEPGSSAINKGTNADVPDGVTTDQRGDGFDRIIGGRVDIGAYESAAAPKSQAVDDDASIDVDETVVGVSPTVTDSTTASGNVLANDKNLATDASAITEVTDAKNPSGVTPDAHGVITIDGTYGTLVLQTTGAHAGDYTYTLDNGAVPPVSATDTFTYTLTDGLANSSTANLTVDLNVNQTLIPPSKAFDDDANIEVSETTVGSSTTVTNATTASGNVIANDLGLDTDPSAITEVTDAKNSSGVTPDPNGLIRIDGAYGTLVLSVLARNANQPGDYSYNLDLGAVPPLNAVDTFTYKLTDIYGVSSLANLTVDLTVVTAHAPVARADTASTTPDKPVTVDVLANDTDPDGKGARPTLFAIVSGPANGMASIVSGKIVYTPSTGFHGSDAIVYRIKGASGLTATAKLTITVGSGVGVGIDASNPSLTDLDIVGTTGNDNIQVKFGGTQGKATVFFGSTKKGTFNFTGRILIYGQSGNDTITVDPKITRSTFISGDDGNDTVNGGGGSDMIFGGEGSDHLSGNAGRDMLFGGDGADFLNGGADDDVLDAGTTLYDSNLAVITAWQKEWSRTDKTYAQRVSDFTNGTGFTSGFKLNKTTTFSAPNPVDNLTGGAGQDLFYSNPTQPGDKITDRVASGSLAETMVAIST